MWGDANMKESELRGRVSIPAVPRAEPRLFQDGAQRQPAFLIRSRRAEREEAEGKRARQPWASHYAYGKYAGLS